MNSRVKLTLQGIVLSLAACALLGANGDSGCFESAEQLCKNTGGTWGPTASWPTPCGEDPAEVTGKAVKAGESACMCPADKPNWKDGTGCLKCATRHELCAATGGTWGTAPFWPAACGDDPALHQGRARNGNEGVCTCPADRPNWTDGTGCQKCRIIRCKGSATWCSSFSGSQFGCIAQDGCYFSSGEWRERCSYASDNPYDPYGDDDYDSYDPYDDYDNDYDDDDDYDNYDPYDDYDDDYDHTPTCTQYYTGDSCNGFAHSCDSYETEMSCISQKGCYWRP